MADQFIITPPVVRAEGKDVPPEQIQAGFNSLARQVQIGLNSVASDPSGPASGDLGGTYPAPTVVAVHAVGGTLDGVVIGSVTPSTGAFTTVTASTPLAVTSGGTGQNALNAHNVIIGEGSSAVGFAAPGASGQMLISTGATTDPAFSGAPVITGGSINAAPIGQTTPAAGSFTTLAASSTVSGAGFTSLFASPPPVGSTAANTGAFTTLAASSTVSGTGFVNRFASPGPIGNTAASTGAFTTLSSTGAFTPSSTNGIVGTTTNDNANAGSVGEYVSNSASGTAVTNATVFNATSVSLTAGDWDVQGTLQFIPTGAVTMTAADAGISTTSVTFGGIGTYTAIFGANLVSSTNGPVIPSPVTRISIATTATVFLVGISNFSGGTSVTASSFIRARRAR